MENINKKPLFCICGESACGKDTLVSLLIEKYEGKLKEICSYTTRPMRDGETEGKEHYFVTEEMFHEIKEKNGDKVLAYTKICAESNPDGFEYMALVDELEHANMYIIDPKGIKYLKEFYPESNLVIIYITSSLQDRIYRASQRSDFDTQFKNRVISEFEQFLDFNIKKEYDYIIYNENFKQTESLNALCYIIDKYI